MFICSVLISLLGSASLLEGAVINPSLVETKSNASPTCLNANALQGASDLTGQEDGTQGIKAGQAPSATDPANFINFCSGQQITNGMQITTGSCNGIPMGKIPATKNMISAMITNPQLGDRIPADSTFNISVQTAHLDAGFFVNPTTNYYTAPQDLNQNGDIIGHCHVTVQDIGSLKSTTPPDPTKFAFFKGIDDAGNGNGLLQAVVTGGLPAGVYRVCTMIAARNHQPVNMPVAQRGAQDDCNKFEVFASSPNSGKIPSKNKNGNGDANTADEGLTTAMSSVVASATAASSSAGNSVPSPSKDAGSIAPGGNGGKGNVAVKSDSLGGAAPPVTDSGNPDRPFTVNGNTFVNKAAAVQRSCDIQFNTCADAVNGRKLQGSSVSDCQKQRDGCREA